MREKRLVILEQKIKNENYSLLMYSNSYHGWDEKISLNICKVFCLGFITGSNNKIKIVNELNEFDNIESVNDSYGYVEIKRILPYGSDLLETYTERIYNNGKKEKINYKIVPLGYSTELQMPL